MVTSILTILMYILGGIGVFGLVALIISPFIYLSLWLKEKRIAKKIPIEIIREVTEYNDRRKYRKTIGGSSTDNSNLPVTTDPIEPDQVQRMDDGASVSIKGGNKSNRFNPI